MRFEVVAYPRPWQAVAAVFALVSRGSLVAIAAFILLVDSRLDPPLLLHRPVRLARVLVLWSLAPGIVAWGLQRAWRARLETRGGRLVLTGRLTRHDLPADAIAGAVPWLIPLPGPGLSLDVPADPGLPRHLQSADPGALARALADAGASPTVGALEAHPAAVYARARAAARSVWDDWRLAVVLYALVPALPLFRLHQWVAYGGTFGEYYLFGLKAWLLGLAAYWGIAVMYLLLYAAALRALVEALALAGAHATPSRALALRRGLERLRRLAHYGGVPLFLAWFFFGRS